MLIALTLQVMLYKLERIRMTSIKIGEFHVHLRYDARFVNSHTKRMLPRELYCAFVLTGFGDLMTSS